MNSDNQNNQSEDKPWDQTFESQTDESGSLSRVKMRKQNRSHNLVTITLVSLIAIVAIVALVYGLSKQNTMGKSEQSPDTTSLKVVDQDDNAKKKSSSTKKVQSPKKTESQTHVKKAVTANKHYEKHNETTNNEAVSDNNPSNSYQSSASSAETTPTSPNTNQASQPQTNQTNQQSSDNSNSAAASSTTSASKGYATVESGQGMYRVAVNNGLTVSELMKMNGLTSESQLHPGQKLRVK